MTLLALDIGGANLKAADGLGWAGSRPFALWREPQRLADELAALTATGPAADRLAVTMTGELCDCFRTKSEGVDHILSAVEQVAAGREVAVYLADGRLASIEEARERSHLAAASNWHALAQFTCRYLNGNSGLLIDIGSTTTDIVPLADGRPVPTALTDAERLLASELVYSGVGRTPLCALVRSLPWQGQPYPVAAELFATTADAYVLLGDIEEEPDADWPSDSRPLTVEFARERIARSICADRTQLTPDDARHAAAHVRDAQYKQIRSAVMKVIERLQKQSKYLILSGSGEFLARRVAKSIAGSFTIISLTEELGPAISCCAPAHALATLAIEAPSKLSSFRT